MGGGGTLHLSRVRHDVRRIKRMQMLCWMLTTEPSGRRWSVPRRDLQPTQDPAPAGWRRCRYPTTPPELFQKKKCQSEQTRLVSKGKSRSAALLTQSGLSLLHRYGISLTCISMPFRLTMTTAPRTDCHHNQIVIRLQADPRLGLSCPLRLWGLPLGVDRGGSRWPM